jgi:uncharacterized phage infection (PIP) family protein YhgE
MGLFHKKSDVPKMPKMASLPKLEDTTHKLPTMGVLKNESVSNEMVKSAVSETGSSGISEPIRSTLDMHQSSLPPMEIPSSMPPVHSFDDSKKAIYVKLDKFNRAQKEFNEVVDKLAEMEALVNKAKQVNEKERLELNSWTESLSDLKAKLTEIDSDVFNQL